MPSILIKYFTNNILPYLYDFFMSIGFRWIIYILLFVLNIYSYYENPKLYTNSKKCFKINCKIFTFITGMISITLTLSGLILLWYVAPFSNSFPEYWYIPVIILTYAIMIQITLTTDIQKEDGSFNPPPENLISKKYRILLNVFILILLIIYFIQLYLDGGNNLINSQRSGNSGVLSYFSDITAEKYILFVEFFALIKILNKLLEIKNVIDFNACSYGLPLSWNL